ncbi:MAG: hypothetical protein Q8P32_04415 [Candidatus Komeilibacteria bacterium]|nr:hypothetical protein [Candidatus Komeilibacteria bacterium]
MTVNIIAKVVHYAHTGELGELILQTEVGRVCLPVNLLPDQGAALIDGHQVRPEVRQVQFFAELNGSYINQIIGEEVRIYC